MSLWGHANARLTPNESGDLWFCLVDIIRMILLMLGYIQDDDFDKTLILHGSNALEENQNKDIA